MLSRRARSAIAVVLDLGRLARGKPMPAKALAARHDLPPRQFETVLQDLVRAGILKGLRGPHGGYELARERRRITLADIVRATDGRTRGDAASSAPSIELVLGPVLNAACAAFLAELDAFSVEDLCQRAEQMAAESGASGTADYTI